ncbi:hypothetical protein [Natranaeroarchaeum aerophilus]|uniref:Uncharacterized protein n=1 Tax=Natranaeroarchaeum aerophilus TaxID=2917711 RepID=A0AAE3K8G4_9EURY|nr:hypothetical protein [Natranaeroarchaeum aerophilus]MCL9814949.1 hypothetical protein [Natranaeroarchaeum aerophilus]
MMFLTVVFITGLGGIASADDCEIVHDSTSNTEKLESTEDDIEYFILIDKERECGTIRLSNTGDELGIVLASVFVDDEDILNTSPELEPGEKWSTTWDFSQKYDVTNDTHSVRVSTTGPDLEAAIEKDFDLADPDIPAQRITDVDLDEGTNEDGERIAEAIVTFEDPSPHGHGGEVFVHTEETHGSGELALVPMSEQTATSKIELDDDPDGTIEGEIRYSAEGVNQDEGVRDQVWFRGEVGGDVTVQRQEFEPAEYPGEDDAYRYDSDGSVLEYIPPSEHLLVGVVLSGVLPIAVMRRYWN